MIDPAHLRELVALQPEELSAYLDGYDRAMNYCEGALCAVERVQRYLWAMILVAFLLGLASGWLMGILLA